ncbi:MAG: hypothetical protein WCG36_00270 [bacterium]
MIEEKRDVIESAFRWSRYSERQIKDENIMSALTLVQQEFLSRRLDQDPVLFDPWGFDLLCRPTAMG